MTEKFCSGCRRYYPEENMRRKRLRNGGIRLICTGCIVRTKTRQDAPMEQKPWQGLTPEDLEQLTHRALPPWVEKLVQDVETLLKERNA